MSKAPTQVGTNTTTTTNMPPPYIAEAQSNLMNAGGRLTGPLVENGVPQYTVAGFTPDQQMGFTLARNLAQDAFSGNLAYDGANANRWTRAQPINGSVTADKINPNNVAADKIDPNAVVQASQAYMNPYQQQVAGTTTQQLTEANDKQLAAIRARQAAEGAYGGNRASLETSEQNRNFGNTLANTLANLNQQGFNTAVGQANQNLTQNAAWENQARLTNNQNAVQNAAWENQARLTNNQNAVQDASSQNQANIFNAQQAMQSSQSAFQQQLQALQALMTGGGQQQQVAQQALQVPYTALNQFAGIVPGSPGSTGSSSQPIYGASPWSTALGLGTLAGGLLSDRTTKKDIKKLGEDPETGLTHYTYNYKDDPKGMPKRVGPMAQDVEKTFPGSTKKIGGKMVIKGDAARKILGL